VSSRNLIPALIDRKPLRETRVAASSCLAVGDVECEVACREEEENRVEILGRDCITG